MRMNLPVRYAALTLVFSVAGGCSDPKPTPDPDPAPKAEGKKEDPTAPDKPALSEFTPIPFEGNHLPLTPRTLTEAQVDELIKGIDIKLRGPGFRRITFDLQYGPELNLNPGPSGMRPTFEGTDMVIDLRTVQIKDGSIIEIDRYGGSSQTWMPEEKRFRDSRKVNLKDDVKKGTLDRVEGDVVLQFAVDTKALEFTRPEDTGKIKSEEIPIDGLTVTPFWDQRYFQIKFEAGSRDKIVHIRGIDEDGQELQIVSVGGLDSRKNPEAGRHAYHFADNGKKLRTIHFYAAPKVVERRIPFDLKMEE